ncbi:hypothetical protein, partial [Prevotella melaninogenica]|uniref:hypothetical protein n=1 Tax=Prevotella melaninogenica TaxID=28132 RepID=UPI001E2E3E69
GSYAFNSFLNERAVHCLLIFFSWGLLAPKPLGVFWYRLLSYTSTWDCSSMLNLRSFDIEKTPFWLAKGALLESY